jgi:hypothetical protein
LELLIEYKNRREKEKQVSEREREKRKGRREGVKKAGREGRWGIDKRSAEASGSAAPGMRLNCSASGGAPLREAPMARD